MEEETAKKRVMVVDDEPSIVKLAKVKLEKEGFEVIEASNGVEALEKVSKEKPDLIILDIMMPRMDGKETCKRLQANPETEEIPIVFLTAVGQFEEQLKGLESKGVTEYVTKPFIPAELAKIVKTVLGGAEKKDLDKSKQRKEAKLRTIVEIMRRDEDK